MGIEEDMKIEFLQDFVKIKGNPIQLYDYQLKFLKDTSKFRIVNKSRQVGLSFIIAAEALADCFFEKNYLALFVSTGERASRNLMEYVMFVYNQLPDFIREKLKLVEQTKTSVAFKNGSRIYSLPSNPKGIRGFRADKVYLDEFAFMEDIDSIWESIIPSVSRGGEVTGKVTIISTPFGDNNKFYDMWSNKNGKYNHYSRHQIHWSECEDLQIEEIKAALTEEQFRQEYCNEFLSEADSFFPYELIRKCVDTNLIQQAQRESTNPYFFGIDFAKERDSTVIIGIERASKKFIVRHIKEFMPTTEQMIQDQYYSKIQIPYIIEINGRFRPDFIAIDEMSIGGKIKEDLVARLGGKIRGIKFSNKSKYLMIQRLKKAFEEGELLIPDNPKLIAQLHYLKVKYSEHGNMPSYFHRDGEHDDYVWALAMAYWISQQAKLVFV